MKTLILGSMLLVGVMAVAKDKSYETGSLKEMTSVECGYEQKTGGSFVGDLLGTDSSHSKARKTFCQEYVLETSHTVYRIRPREEKHPALLPVGEKAEFRMKNDHIVLRVPEGDNKEREYEVVYASPVDKAQTVTTKK